MRVLCPWNDPHHPLTFESLLAKFVPALIELTLVFLNPLFRRVMRSVCRTGCIVDEEWLVRRHRLLELDPLDGLGRHVGGEVVVFLIFLRDSCHAVKDHRLPLICFPSNKAIELVEAGMCGPAEVRTGD